MNAQEALLAAGTLALFAQQTMAQHAGDHHPAPDGPAYLPWAILGGVVAMTGVVGYAVYSSNCCGLFSDSNSQVTNQTPLNATSVTNV